ncbi:hypothetical protein XENORESO_002797 [Xenotaenia resolanae]|uniref:Uncharacterized protein n=1 Tax=Xenotaenia resolanae TaxID=208358 RepID=A0ABV0X0P2_9TELE
MSRFSLFETGLTDLSNSRGTNDFLLAGLQAGSIVHEGSLLIHVAAFRQSAGISTHCYDNMDMDIVECCAIKMYFGWNIERRHSVLTVLRANSNEQNHSRQALSQPIWTCGKQETHSSYN